MHGACCLTGNHVEIPPQPHSGKRQLQSRGRVATAVEGPPAYLFNPNIQSSATVCTAQDRGTPGMCITFPTSMETSEKQIML